MKTPVLKCNIQLKRNDFLLDVNVKIGNGIIGVYGQSGHGKTSWLNAVTGLINPDSGYIEINGRVVFDSKRKINSSVRNRKIGYVFQDIRLFPHLSVKQNLKYGINTNAESGLHFNEVVAVLNIENLLNKKPSECSGGEKQRIAMGRALLSGAQILVMDEPFSAVDVNLRKNIIPYLNEINQQFNIPMIIVSHDLPDLLSLTNNLILFKNGKVKAHGKFQDLILDESNIVVMKGAGLYNVYDLYVFAALPSQSMVLLKSANNNFQIQVLCQSFQKTVEIGKKMKVLIRPEDISIALHPVTQISLRNQLKGTIEKIFSKDGLSFCIVNTGEKVLVEITEASVKTMNLEVGKRVYCLFKSAALKIF